MSKYHSTVTRRGFMKALGLGAAGLGTVAAAAPVFRDLDELTSASEPVRKMPWWVKEREFFDTTNEVDWDIKELFDQRNHYKTPPEESQRLFANQMGKIKEGITNNDPGYSLRDYAMWSAFMEGWFKSSTPYKGRPPMLMAMIPTNIQQLGIPRWQGSPDDNTRMVTAALHYFGAREVGVVEVTDKTKKVWYKCDGGGRPYSWEDVDEPYDDDTKAAVIPNKCRYIISYVVPQSGMTKTLLTPLGNISPASGYYAQEVMMPLIQTFLYGLGYQGLTSAAGGIRVGLGALAGVGELSRTDYLLSPYHGTLFRMADFMVTDLPLAPTKPIDFGAFKFCHACKKCADMCPSNAIPSDDEPSWEPSGLWNAHGVKAFHIDYKKCLPWRGMPGGEIGGACGNCQAVCVFSKLDKAVVHETIKAIVTNTSAFNGFFRSMDDIFGYPEEIDPVAWWDRNPEDYPYRGFYFNL